MARRLLDLPPSDPFDGIDPFRFRLGQGLPGDDDGRRRRKRVRQRVLQYVVKRHANGEQGSRGDGEQRPRSPPRPGQVIGLV